jgi:hypothetical protein
MICPACAQAATPQTQTAAVATAGTASTIQVTAQQHWHDPAICVNAAHTDQDIRLFGRKCPCQHGRNGGQRAATEGNDRG